MKKLHLAEIAADRRDLARQARRIADMALSNSDPQIRVMHSSIMDEATRIEKEAEAMDAKAKDGYLAFTPED